MAEPDFLCSANGCFMPSDRSRAGIKSLCQRVDVRTSFEGLNDFFDSGFPPLPASFCTRMMPVEEERAKSKWGSFQSTTMGLSAILVDFSLIVLGKRPVSTKSDTGGEVEKRLDLIQ
jgi:hypothetical protein